MGPKLFLAGSCAQRIVVYFCEGSPAHGVTQKEALIIEFSKRRVAQETDCIRKVPDGSSALHAEPLGQRPILLHLLGQVHLQLEGLDGAHFCLSFSPVTIPLL